MSDDRPRYQPPLARDLGAGETRGGPGPEGFCTDGSMPYLACKPVGQFPKQPSYCAPGGSVYLLCQAGASVTGRDST